MASSNRHGARVCNVSVKSINDNKDGNNYREQGQVVVMVAMMRRSCNTHMHMHSQVHKSMLQKCAPKLGSRHKTQDTYMTVYS